MIPDHTLPLEELKVGRVKCHMLDSGAYTQRTQSKEYAKQHKCGRWDYFHTETFMEYMISYAAFVKKYAHAIDYHVNVDVIGNPKLTWRNQKYLEDLGLTPIPVVHLGTDVKWLEWYIKKGYDYIGLGSPEGSMSNEIYDKWLDRYFTLVCPAPKRLPTIKFHGFALTAYQLLIRFPWASVDSSSWTKIGAYGGILVPHKRMINGKWKWDFSEDPYLMKVSNEAPDRKKQGRHVLTLAKAETAIIKEWLDSIEVPLGKIDKNGVATEWGVTTHHTYRKAANLLFYEALREWLPEYPFKYQRDTINKGFGLF